MTTPGSNLLRKALRAIKSQPVSLYRWTGNLTNAAGFDVSSYAVGELIVEGSVQAVPRRRYEYMGLDYSRNYVTWFVSAEVLGVERDNSPDQFEWNNRRFEVKSVTAWNAQDGWNEVLAVDVGMAFGGSDVDCPCVDDIDGGTFN